MGYNVLWLKFIFFLGIFLKYLYASSFSGCGKCDLPDCDIDCLGSSAVIKCPSRNCTSTVCCTVNHVANADCRGCSCDAQCKGKSCTSNCRGPSCISTCRGPGCYSECKGNKCNAICHGEKCTAWCSGHVCNTKCVGKGCTKSSVINFIRDPEFETHEAYQEKIDKKYHNITSHQNVKNQQNTKNHDKFVKEDQKHKENGKVNGSFADLTVMRGTLGKI